MNTVKDNRGTIRVFDNRHLSVLEAIKKLLPQNDHKVDLGGFDVKEYRKGIYGQRVKLIGTTLTELRTVSEEIGEILGALKTYKHVFKRSGDDAIDVPVKLVDNQAAEFRGKVDALIQWKTEGARKEGALLARVKSLEQLIAQLSTICTRANAIKRDLKARMGLGVTNPELEKEMNDVMKKLEQLEKKLKTANKKEKKGLEADKEKLLREWDLLEAKIMSFSSRESIYIDSINECSTCPDLAAMETLIIRIRNDMDAAKNLMRNFDSSEVREAARILDGTSPRIKSEKEKNMRGQLINAARAALKLRKGHMEKTSAKLGRASATTDELFDKIFAEVTRLDKLLKGEISAAEKSLAFNETLVSRSQ